MAADISITNSRGTYTVPWSVAAPAPSVQKSAKERADAYANNFANQTYHDAASAAAYGSATGEEIGPGGVPIKTYNVDQQKYLGIDASMQKYGFIPFTMPMRPADNAPEGQWVDYEEKLKRAARPPVYQVSSPYQTLQNMDEASIRGLQQQFAKAGMYPKGYYFIPGRASSQDIKILSDMMGEGNVSGLPWEEVLKIKFGAKAGKFGGSGSGTSSTSTQISYTQTSIANGRALLQKTLGSAIGRDPSDAELKRYMKMVHDAESNSPSRTVTTSSGKTTVSRTTPSDVDTADMALDFAKEIGGGDPYRERKASHYLDLIMNRGGLNIGG